MAFWVACLASEPSEHEPSRARQTQGDDIARQDTKKRDPQLRLIEVYGAFTYPFLCVPFLYFYFRDHGITVAQFTLLISVYYATMVLLEVPTGIFADRHGRKPAMLLGPLLLAIGFAVLFFGRTLFVFCAGQVLLGLGHAFLSGAPTALLFDLLARRERGAEFFAAESRVQAYRLLGTAFSFLAGGLVVRLFGISISILATSAMCLLAAGTAMLIEEPRRTSVVPRLGLLATAGRQLSAAPVLWITAYYVLVFVLLRYCFHTYQIFMEAAHTENPLVVGSLFCAMNLVAAPCSRMAPRLLRRFGARSLFWFMGSTLALSLIAMAGLVQRLGLVVFFVHQVPFGMHWALVQDFVNQRVKERARATVLSMLSLAGRLGFVPFFALVGQLHAHAGLRQTYLIVGGLGLIACTLCMRVGKNFLPR